MADNHEVTAVHAMTGGPGLSKTNIEVAARGKWRPNFSDGETTDERRGHGTWDRKIKMSIDFRRKVAYTRARTQAPSSLR